MCTYVKKTPSMLQDELTRVGFVFAVCHIDVKSISLKHKDTILMFRTSLENLRNDNKSTVRDKNTHLQ